MANGEICWWEIEVPDAERAKDFYGRAFGWDFEPMPGYDGYLMAKLDGKTIGAIQASQEPVPAGRAVRLYVETDDLEAAVRRTEDAGGAVDMARTPIGDTGGWFALVRDPFGSRIGIWTGQAAG
ncbi:MAG TPA: VOC family protein [Candidatus Dormibacteraeota bacterium]|jgi:hypothetical protein|nr:VOC family protein [Candidatus Dormibacteraeota bacterium]